MCVLLLPQTVSSSWSARRSKQAFSIMCASTYIVLCGLPGNKMSCPVRSICLLAGSRCWHTGARVSSSIVTVLVFKIHHQSWQVAISLDLNCQLFVERQIDDFMDLPQLIVFFIERIQIKRGIWRETRVLPSLGSGEKQLPWLAGNTLSEQFANHITHILPYLK